MSGWMGSLSGLHQMVIMLNLWEFSVLTALPELMGSLTGLQAMDPCHLASEKKQAFGFGYNLLPIINTQTSLLRFRRHCFVATPLFTKPVTPPHSSCVSFELPSSSSSASS